MSSSAMKLRPSVSLKAPWPTSFMRASSSGDQPLSSCVVSAADMLDILRMILGGDTTIKIKNI